MARIFQRSTFRSAAVTGLASVVILGLMATGAQADPHGPKHPKPVCKFTGTFFPPTPTSPTTADVLSTALGDCSKGLGHTAHTGVLTTDFGTFDVSGAGCIDIASSSGLVAFNKKGDSISYTLSGTQCLRDANGDALTDLSGTACAGGANNLQTSVIDGTITLTGGTGKTTGASGTGSITGIVNHCATKFPFFNSFKGTITGISLP